MTTTTTTMTSGGRHPAGQNRPRLACPGGATVPSGTFHDFPHRVVAAETLAWPPALDTGACFTFTFTQAGDVPDFCGLHPHWQGKITVVPEGGRRLSWKQ